MHFARRDRDRLNDSTDLVLELVGEPEHCSVALLFGALLDFGPLQVGACLGGVRLLRLRRFLCRRLEGLREPARENDQDAGLKGNNNAVQSDPPQIAAAWIDGRWQQEVEHKMVKYDRR